MKRQRSTGKCADLLLSASLFLLAVVAPGSSFSQGIQLSPAQQQMLNALPAEQRAQALRAIRDLQGQTTSGVSQSINETENEALALDEVTQVLQSQTAEPLRAAARSRIIIGFTPKSDLTSIDRDRVSNDPLLAGLVGDQHFILGENGELKIDGLESIPLLGLEESDIQRRLAAERAFVVFDVDVKILQQQLVGVEALNRFGFEMFDIEGGELSAPATGPVPGDYVLAAGDNVRLQLFGNVNNVYELEVSRDGILNVPELGPINVTGLRFSDFREELNKTVEATLIGTQVSVTMGVLRSIRVFVLGDVKKPGSHVVGGLATISSALYKSGGVTDIGSLRKVQLKRSGRVVTTLDFYDLLVNGDTSGDRRLLPGDVIFVPPVTGTVAAAGAVRRPAIYEILPHETVADIIKLAGGFAADAFAGGATLERVSSVNGRGVIALDLNSAGDASTAVRNGDILSVPNVLPGLDNSIQLVGHVYRPGTYAWNPGMRLTDLIPSPRELKPGVDMQYVLVRRERSRGKPIEVLSANLADAFSMRRGTADLALMPQDRVYVFSQFLGRERIVQPIVDELKTQATRDNPARQVEVAGFVRAQGVYPLEDEMQVADLVRAGGSLSEEAYALHAELTRYSIVDGERRVIEVLPIDLARAIDGDAEANIRLKPYDYLRIGKLPEWDVNWTVELEGEVLFPGSYRVKRGETLTDVILRAGGLTESAFPEGAVFLRKSLKEREREQIEMLARRLESDLTSLSLQQVDTGGSATLATGRTLLEQLRETEPVGRLVIDAELLSGGDTRRRPEIEIELRDGDRLLVPPRSQVVTVIGETQQNTSHLYSPGLSRDEYIDLSGGLTRRADKKRIYVVRANGAVVVASRSRWLGRGGAVEIRPGDTIVVPLDADRMRPLSFWTSVTQILYQGAIAIAAVRTFNN